MIDAARTRCWPTGNATLQRGFSLTEMVVSLLILSIVALLSALTFLALNKAKAEAVRRADLAERGRVMLELIVTELKSATTAAGEGVPPYRFVGINKEYYGTSVDYAALIRAGITDERAIIEALSNRNDDGDVGPDGRERINEDPWNGIDDDGDALVDEDALTIPRDLINLVSSVPNNGLLDVVELGYCLSAKPEANKIAEFRSDRLYRRFNEFNPEREDFDLARSFGRFYDIRTGKDHDYLTSETVFISQPTTEVVDYDVVGLDLYYWYYDHGDTEETTDDYWAYTDSWDSAVEAALEPQERKNNLGRAIHNEPEDAIQFLRESESNRQNGDGLPLMVEVRLFLQDRNREFPPKMLGTRVYLPSE